MKQELTLSKMYEMNKKATKVLYDRIKKTEGVKVLYEDNEGIEFEYEGHTYLFTCEFVD